MLLADATKRAWALIDTPEKHIREKIWANENDIECSLKDACKFCSIGAINAVMFGPKQIFLTETQLHMVKDIQFLLSREIKTEIGNVMISVFNDTYPYPTIAKIWARTIKAAEAHDARQDAFLKGCLS